MVATGVNGTTNLSYQWTLNGTDVNLLADKANFTGANSNILTIASVAPADAGTYQLIVTNQYGTNHSSNAVLVIQARALVGEWLNGSTNFAEVSGYTRAGTHDGYIVGAGNYMFTNDVPPGKSGQSLFFYNGDTGLAISNSSTLDANYTNTFDNVINRAFTVSFWSKGWPTIWSPWVSKYGELWPYGGWQFRVAGNTDFSCFTVRDNGGGASNLVSGSTFGAAPWDDMSTTNIPSDDGSWHFYVGTFDTVSGQRALYVDGMLAANESSGNTPYSLAAAEHLCIGAKDSPPGNSFGYFSTFEIYDVRVFNYAPPITGGVPVIWRVIPGAKGGNLVLTWPFGTLFQATKLAGPWTSTGTASPCTNSMTAPEMFFKASQSEVVPLR
jgi:hypothetical protein